MADPKPYQVAARLRAAATRARTLTGELQRGSWSGGHGDDSTIANLTRAAVLLDDAAKALDGDALPGRQFVIGSAVSTGLFAGGIAAVLATVPDPGRPWVVVCAVVAGWVAADIFGRWHDAARARRSTAAPDAPPDGSTDERVGRIRAEVAELLPAVRHKDAAEFVRVALIWL
ncbi:hypothetical protein [Asanoa sp. NPDC050611]|uniref:hypothetical protein n=1 Tax=Asanoa sp. NPDC050611 TaxID=3157098 RepID=UPI0033DE5D01